MAKKIIAALLAVFVFAGCATVTTIRTDPPGAKVYINEQPRGLTPYVEELSNFVFTTYNVRITLDGYDDFYGRLLKEAKVGAIVGGFIIFPAWLWAAGPQPNYFFELGKKE